MLGGSCAWSRLPELAQPPRDPRPGDEARMAQQQRTEQISPQPLGWITDESGGAGLGEAFLGLVRQ